MARKNGLGAEQIDTSGGRAAVKDEGGAVATRGVKGGRGTQKRSNRIKSDGEKPRKKETEADRELALFTVD